MSVEAITGLGSSFPLTSENPLTAGARIYEGPRALDSAEGLIGANGLPGTSTEIQVSGPGFGDILSGAIQDAAAAGHTAEAKAEALAKGAIDDIHGTMISAKEAEISLKLVGAIRNKLLDAFHELWRTNV